MICLPDVEMPKNCHECDALGISDVVGLKCPCAMNIELYSFDNRPDECPLKELKVETNDTTIPIPTDDGYLCCDACGCEIKEGQIKCEGCGRKIDWNK